MTELVAKPVAQLTDSEYEACYSMNFGGNGLMQRSLVKARAEGYGDAVMILDDAGRLMAWSLVAKDGEHDFAQFYTSPPHRSKGLASQIMEYVLANFANPKGQPNTHQEESRRFFQKYRAHIHLSKSSEERMNQALTMEWARGLDRNAVSIYHTHNIHPKKQKQLKEISTPRMASDLEYLCAIPRHPYHNGTVCYIWENQEIVAWAIGHNIRALNGHVDLQIFVRPEHRRKGHATKLLAQMLIQHEGRVRAFPHDDSVEFWQTHADKVILTASGKQKIAEAEAVASS